MAHIFPDEVLFSFTPLGLATDEFVPLHNIGADGRRFIALRAVGATSDDIQRLVVVEKFLRGAGGERWGIE